GVGLGAGVGGTFWIGAGGVTASEAGEGAGDGDGDGLGDVSAVWAAAPFAIRSAPKTTAATIERSDHIRRHSHHVEPAVDVQHFARDPAREAGDEEERGVADLLLLGVPAQGRVVAVVLEHLRDAVNAGGGDGLDRP